MSPQRGCSKGTLPPLLLEALELSASQTTGSSSPWTHPPNRYQREKRKTNKKAARFTKYKESNKTLGQDWVTGVTHSLLTHLLSPCSQFDQILWCQDPSLGGLDTTVGATEVLGPTPHPTAPRGTELPSPAGFPQGPRPLQDCLAAVQGEEGAQPASKGFLLSLPLLVAGPERLCRWCCLCSARREEEEAGGRHRKAGQLTAQHKSSTTDAARLR